MREKEKLVDWITEQAGGEPIEAVVLGEMGWENYNVPADLAQSGWPKGELLSWEQAQKYLTYEFDSGFGAPGCFAVYAWTKTWIIFVSEYDGATGPCRIPRHPVAVMPEMPGGG